MADVAERAGVSRTTASYVLNGQDKGIPEATRLRVRQAAAALGFTPNRLAQRLAGQRSGLVGLVIPDISSPFFSSLVSHLHDAARARDTHVLPELSPTAYGDWLWRAAIDRLLGWQVDGLLLWTWALPPSDEAARALLAAAAGVPVVELGQEPPAASTADGVYVDFGSGTRLLMDHLLALGHRRFAFLGYGVPATDSRARAPMDVRGLAVAAAAELAPLMLEATGLDDARRLGAAVGQGIVSGQPDAPTAIVCLNDMLALAASRGLSDVGCHLPGDVSLVSCDGGWAGSYFSPELTRLHVPFAALAEQVLTLLDARLAGSTEPPVGLALVPTLALGHSTGPARPAQRR
ncbi:MAG: LacI family DNA-binding transcriptional regulator [Armatimonadetes bacterium]|nr:LacI family DNA-binding transcriptional regulator [Armatimonadota bacterium]